MKRILAVFLVAMMIISTTLISFAGVPKDVSGTDYEKAVTALMAQRIISGYEDGTYKPEDSINRTEACIMIIKALSIEDKVLKKALKNTFKDMKGYAWAESYINYASDNEIINGNGSGMFLPGKAISYQEMAKMIVSALGYKQSELKGTWPNNYYNKAKEIGVFKNIPNIEAIVGSQEVNRGTVALMIYAVLPEFEKMKSDDDIITDEQNTSNTPAAINAGDLADYTGRAYGVIQSTSKVRDASGDFVDQIEFMKGKNTYNLLTNGDPKVPATYPDGNLYCLKMRKGVVREITTDFASVGATHVKELTTSGSSIYATVASKDDELVHFENGIEHVILSDTAVYYVIEFDDDDMDSYKKGNIGDIRKGSKIRVYDVTDDSSDLGDVIIIVKPNDADKI